MLMLFVRLRNSEFLSRDDGGKYVDAAAALKVGIASAAALATEELIAGRATAAIEITIEQEDGTRLLNSIVSVSVSPLFV